jgi:replication factor C subunit 2/4
MGQGAMEALSTVAGGDMRKAITTLQSAVRLRGSPVEPQTVLDVAGAVPQAAGAALLTACRSGSFSTLQSAVEDVIAAGFPAQELLLRLQEVVLSDAQMTEGMRGAILMRLAETDKDLVDGADETLQLLATAAHAQQVLLSAA